MNAAAGLTPRDGDRRQRIRRVTVVASVPTGRKHVQLLQIERRPVDVGLVDERLAEYRVAQHLQLAPVDRRVQLLPRRRLVEGRPRLEPEQDADPAGGGLWPEVGARCVLLVGETDDRGAEARAFLGLREPEAHGPAALATDLTHQRDLGTRLVEVLVVAFTEAHRPFEHAGAVTAEHLGEGQQFVGSGVGSRHGSSVGYTMQEGAAGRHAERAGTHRLVDEAGHRHHVVARRRSLVEPPLAHHVRPQRTVADEPTGVRAFRQPIDRFVVLAVGLPVPRQRVEDRLARDVLDTLHHLGQHGAVRRLARRERDATVAHHHAGHTVPATRCPDRIPRNLRVQVGVDVDETRGHEAPFGVDLPPAHLLDTTVVERGDLGDHVTGDRDIAQERGRAGAVDDGTSSDDDLRSHVLPRNADC